MLCCEGDFCCGSVVTIQGNVEGEVVTNCRWSIYRRLSAIGSSTSAVYITVWFLVARGVVRRELLTADITDIIFPISDCTAV